MNTNRSKAGGQVTKKDRPKSSDKLKKKRDGTPDKPASPGPDDANNIDTRSSVLNDEEIQALAIKQEELDKIRQEVLERRVTKLSPRGQKVFAVKKIDDNPPPKKLTKLVTVAKGAPPRAPLQPIETEGNSGPRFDENGIVVPHSLLGTLEEYKLTAEKRGELKVDYYIREQDRVNTPTIKKYIKNKNNTENRKSLMDAIDSQNNALEAWQRKMRQRKQQQGYISNLLNKPSEHLVMNQGELYRSKQELRYVMDRAIPAVDYGKGYRVGSEFWNQRSLIGDEDKGMHMTLTQTEMGYPPPIEHIGIPHSVQQERGLDVQKCALSLNKPWHKSSYLHERVNQLKPVMTDLDPHQPQIDELEIVGTSTFRNRYVQQLTPDSMPKSNSFIRDGAMQEEIDENDPLAEHPNVYDAPIFGPCIQFAGQILQWTGDSHSNKGFQAADARVGFETIAGCRASSSLDIVNLGTTAIYYKWKMLPTSNPFDLVNSNVQRFYFNTSNGVIQPGDSLSFPFVFKSEKAGMFTEQWQFETHPSLVGGASLIVSLRGVALREDSYENQRHQLENAFQSNIVWKNVRRIVDELVDSIKEAERPRSPIDTYLTEEDLFKRLNKHLHYEHETVSRLKDLYKIFTQPPSMNVEDKDAYEEIEDTTTWNFNLSEFKRLVMELDDEDERKREFLENINEAVLRLSFPHFTPNLRQMYQGCYQSLTRVLDQLSGHSVYLRNLLGLPEKDPDDQIDETSSDRESVDSSVVERFNARHQISLSVEKLQILTDNTKGQRGTPAKSTPKTSGSKDEKKAGKADSKKDKKETPQKKVDRASPTKKTPAVKPGGSGERIVTPGPDNNRAVSPSQTALDPIQERKYKEKFYSQVYMDLYKMVGDIFDIFEVIHSE